MNADFSFVDEYLPTASNDVASSRNFEPASSSNQNDETSNNMISVSYFQPTADGDAERFCKKRRESSVIEDQSKIDDQDDTANVDSTSAMLENKKQNHSKIEKRRRDKINTHIAELSKMIPLCQSIPHKLDKLTVLRMAVQHLKSIKADSLSYLSERQSKPACLSDQELKNLVLQISDGFVFVVRCDSGTILYTSQSIINVLNYQPSDVVGNSIYGLIHPADVSTVKEQILPVEIGTTKAKFIDVKTMMPVKTSVPSTDPTFLRLGSGSRRSFFFRMQRKTLETEHTIDKFYSVVHCTGYLKSVEYDVINGSSVGNQLNMNEHMESTSDVSNEQICLIAVGRILNGITQFDSQFDECKKQIVFSFRLSTEGKFLFVDQRTTLILGFLPQELIGTSIYEYIYIDDIDNISESHKTVLQTRNVVNVNAYRFPTKNGNFIFLESEWKCFHNPWTNQIEYITAKNIVKWCKESTTTKTNDTYIEKVGLLDMTENNLTVLLMDELMEALQKIKLQNELCHLYVLKTIVMV